MAQAALSAVLGYVLGMAISMVVVAFSGQTALPILMTRAVPAGSRLSIRVAGGGGFGPPSERSPERVATDVRDGLVSIAQAREVYRVAIDPATQQVDEVATTALRTSGIR